MKKVLASLVVIVLLSTANLSVAATYYLSPTGHDSGPGTDGKPWRTFKYAESRLAAGDTVLVRGGTYANGCVIDVPSTTWQAYATEEPVIDGEKIRPGKDCAPLITILASGVKWDGIDIIRSTGYNMHVRGQNYGTHLTGISILNSNISDLCHQNLVVTATDGILIAGCEFAGGNHTLKDGKGVGASVTIAFSERPVFRGNMVREAGREGLIMDRSSSDGLVEYNQIYGNRVTQLYLCNSVRMTVRNNWIQGWVDPANIWIGRANAGTGIMIASELQWGTMPNQDHEIYNNYVEGCRFNLALGTEAGSTPVTGCKIHHNTLANAQPYGDRTEHSGIYVGAHVGDGHEIAHNIIIQHQPSAILYSNGVTWDYNLWTTPPPVGAVGEHDPLYMG